MTHTDETLIDVQLRLESEMTQRGMDRYMKAVTEAKQSGTEDTLSASQTLIKHRTAELATAIRDWLAETAAGRASKRNIAFKYLRDFDPTVVSFITLKKLLGRVSTPVVVQRAARELGTAIEDEIRLADVRAKERKAYDSIVKGAKLRVSEHYKRIYAIRRANEVIEFDQWPETDRMHVGMKLIDLAISTLGWFTVETQQLGKHNTQKILTAAPELLAQMERHHGVTAMLRPVFEPMVVQPRDWTTPHDGGYLSSDIRPLKLVKITSAGYFEELMNTEMPVVYESVNSLQRTAWQINTQVLDVLTEFWERGHALAELPAREGAEIPPKPFDIETNEEARLEWRKRAAKVHQANSQERSKRLSVAFTLDVATRYNQYPRIYFPYQLDFRGRIYAVPAFNPQGPDYMKALLRFAGGKPLGEHGATWLAMHGANVAGNDKCSLEERVQWVLDNEEEIVRCAADPFAHTGWRTEIAGQKIDKPWQFLAFCFEWKGYVDHGEEFVSKLAVALDGSCSGLQHFSAMLRDEVGGAAVNLIPSDTPKDVYGMVAGKVTYQLNGLIASGPSPDGKDDAELADQWLSFGVNRKTCKRSVMTLAYGSKQYGFKDQLLTDILDPALKAATMNGEVDRAKFPFAGDGYKASLFMAGQIWDAVTVTLVKSVEAMQWLQGAAAAVSSEGLPIRWSSPVGFPVMQAYWDTRSRRVETALQGTTVMLTMAENTDTLDRRAQANGISPNFVHSCDAAHMMLTTVRATQEGIHSFAMIHDSFGTTAADTEALFRIVRESFVEMYSEVDVLEQFRDEIVRQLSDEKRAELSPLPTRGTLDLSGVLESRFCFA
jgi:DNA-directed RNA polymerase